MLAGAAAAGDWFAVTRERKPLEYACKPAVMAFLLWAALGLRPDHPAQRGWFVAALALSLAGDVFLMLPRDAFVPGLASFLLAHLAYIAGLRIGGAAWPWVALALVALTLPAAFVGGRIIRALRESSQRALLGPVAAYMAAISLMAACALASRRPLAAGGAALFYVSDSLIAWNRFVRPLRWAPLAIIVTYHLAQAALVLSLT